MLGLKLNHVFSKSGPRLHAIIRWWLYFVLLLLAMYIEPPSCKICGLITSTAWILIVIQDKCIWRFFALHSMAVPRSVDTVGSANWRIQGISNHYVTVCAHQLIFRRVTMATLPKFIPAEMQCWTLLVIVMPLICRMGRNWAGIGPMRAASCRFRSGSGTL